MPCSHTFLLCNEHSGQVSPGSSAQLGVCFQQFCGHIPLSCAAVPHTCTGEQPGRAEGAALRCALGQTLSASLCACFSRKSLGIMSTVLGNGLSRAELAAELRVLTKHISAETAHKINRTMLFFTPFPFFPLVHTNNMDCAAGFLPSQCSCTAVLSLAAVSCSVPREQSLTPR